MPTGHPANGGNLPSVHDGDLSPLIAALNLFDDPIHAPLPLQSIPSSRQWKSSQVLPMGARLSLERMSCRKAGGKDDSDEVYIRINMNDKILQLPGCKAGPGPLEGRAERISFLRQQGKS